MDEEYDVVVCGTGLNECTLSGLLSVHGRKVLHVDRNGYYGDESASLNLTNLWAKFVNGEAPPAELGQNRDWNVDLIPKFVMAGGKLVKILLKTKVTKYLDWQVVEGCYVYQYQKGGIFSSDKFIHKVPATDKEALASPLMGPLEKFRCKNFFQYVANWEADKPETWDNLNPKISTMMDIYNKFGLQNNTIDFIGHALALYTNDDYVKRPCGPTLEKLKLYMLSLSRYGQSPFIYPVYGLGGLPEGFSRLSAVHGGTYMLNTDVDGFVYDAQGKVCGVRGKDGKVAKCKKVVCSPSYALDKVKLVGKVIRVICILDHPIAETAKKSSCQIILPQKQLNRLNDIYVTLVSHTHGVAAHGYYICLVSTTVETDNPVQEVEPGLKLLSPIIKQFVNISNVYEPIDHGEKDGIHVCGSYDATSHFETAADHILKVWKDITGGELDLECIPDENDQDE